MPEEPLEAVPFPGAGFFIGLRNIVLIEAVIALALAAWWMPR